MNWHSLHNHSCCMGTKKVTRQIKDTTGTYCAAIIHWTKRGIRHLETLAIRSPSNVCCPNKPVSLLYFQLQMWMQHHLSHFKKYTHISALENLIQIWKPSNSYQQILSWPAYLSQSKKAKRFTYLPSVASIVKLDTATTKNRWADHEQDDSEDDDGSSEDDDPGHDILCLLYKSTIEQQKCPSFKTPHDSF